MSTQLPDLETRIKGLEIKVQQQQELINYLLEALKKINNP